MRVIKGDIGAKAAFNAAVVFSPQGRQAKEDAKGSRMRRRIALFAGSHSLEALCPLY
jgi:hypothetical protein